MPSNDDDVGASCIAGCLTLLVLVMLCVFMIVVVCFGAVVLLRWMIPG